MSSRPERIEKDCLNCSAIIYGKYCHVCGQANVEPKESFWDLVTHFVYDVTHFDGKFFSTVKSLLVRPGFLTSEYTRGRRTSYLNPIKMYVFTSAFFFLFIYAFYDSQSAGIMNTDIKQSSQVRKKIEKRRLALQKAVKDSTLSDLATQEIFKEDSMLSLDIAHLQTDTSKLDELNYYKNDVFYFKSEKSVEQYDSIQKSLTPAKRDGWITRGFSRKWYALDKEYNGDNKKMFAALSDKFFHSFSS